ncbi:helix-turn-helix domain containing protein [Streptomyces sp. PTM05]|uniref:Helix-turn-helix domain containing protein n=1 Tax=Streptantibioticus parmotrematis TaxID=2873249 RepID=A0ABS7QZM4_9ACTN|nr:helix-turn-helix domain containing protein [Streptantibioticus parmotrematis]MBY8887222.1 helix-turn-helix domain containing protein [Streptantibioticus parmotrematis]
MNPKSLKDQLAGGPSFASSLRRRYEAGATVAELVAETGLSHGTVVNRLHQAGTIMRAPWETRRMREDPERAAARKRLAIRLRRLYESHGATLAELAAAGAGSPRNARRLLLDAGATLRTTQETIRLRSINRTETHRRLLASVRSQYEARVPVAQIAMNHGYSIATIYRLLRQAKTPMRYRNPQTRTASRS